ncbi:hypothetical protein JCM21900_004049 [Sporobolomyces salmonicolor]
MVLSIPTSSSTLSYSVRLRLSDVLLVRTYNIALKPHGLDTLMQLARVVPLHLRLSHNLTQLPLLLVRLRRERHLLRPCGLVLTGAPREELEEEGLCAAVVLGVVLERVAEGRGVREEEAAVEDLELMGG